MRPTTASLRHRVPGLAAVALLITVLVAGCGVGWQDQQISQVTVDGDDRTLTVAWHCHLDSSVTAEETPAEVRLSFRVYSYRGDCAGTEVLRLREPLGDRTIIDASTGRSVVPCAADDEACIER